MLTKKNLFVLLIGLVVLALIAACGGAAPEPAAEEQAPAEEAAPAEEEAPAEEAAAPAEEEAPAEEAMMSELPPPPEGVTELNILWAQWDPADYLQEIGNMYEAETISAGGIGIEGSILAPYADRLPETERYFAEAVSLPLFPAMTDGDVNDVVAAAFLGLMPSQTRTGTMKLPPPTPRRPAMNPAKPPMERPYPSCLPRDCSTSRSLAL